MTYEIKELTLIPRRDNLDESIRAALRQLIDRGLTANVDLSAVVPEDVQSSWRRSISANVDPASLPKIVGLEEQEELLERTVSRVLDRWHQTLTNTRTVLLFGNAAGQIIHRRSLDAREGNQLDRAGAVEGSDFSESGAGTNGLGTSIESRHPILIRGGQHYLDSLSAIACAAAPVIHPLTGRVLGSVSISAPASEASQYMVAITQQASDEIAAGLIEGARSRDVEMVRAFRKARQSQRGVLIMNQDSMMADMPSLPHIDPEVHAALWDQFQRRLEQGEIQNFEIEDAGIAGTVTNVGFGSDPILQLRLRQLRNTEETPKAVPPRSSGQTATTIGPPADADPEVAKWWHEMNVVAQQSNKPLVVHVPIGSDGTEWVNRWSSLSGRDRISIEQRGRPQVAPDSETGPMFPSLADRRLALADLARSVYRGTSQPPRFTSEALAAMLAWPWPGDMQELTELVNSLTETSAETWTVQLQDLPPHLATGTARTLSRWEQAERDSIMSALFDAQGNKSEAAEILGIGRTTLYRKLRSLAISDAQVNALLLYRGFPV